MWFQSSSTRSSYQSSVKESMNSQKDIFNVSYDVSLDILGCYCSTSCAKWVKWQKWVVIQFFFLSRCADEENLRKSFAAFFQKGNENYWNGKWLLQRSWWVQRRRSSREKKVEIRSLNRILTIICFRGNEQFQFNDQKNNCFSFFYMLFQFADNYTISQVQLKLY